MRKSKFNWATSLFLIGYHLSLVILLPLYLVHCTPSGLLIALSTALLFLTGVCLTAGYHRLYSHSAFKVHPVAELFLLFFSTMSTHGSVLRWSFEHRHHHAYVDSDRDPYSIKKGFWYAHCLWMFKKSEPIDPKVVADLLRNPIVRFQDRFYAPLMVLTNTLAFLLMGWLCGDYYGAFVIGWLARLFLMHHFSWSINSLAHTWGARSFCEELSAVDNFIISLVTFGEGYHNYHHTFASDYRNGIRWYHFDPTKWLVWLLSKLRLASHLRRAHPCQIDRRLLQERKEMLLNRVRSSLASCKEEWEEKIDQAAEEILAKLQEVKQLYDQYAQAVKKGQKEGLHELQLLIRKGRKGLKEELRQWRLLYRSIMRDARANSAPSTAY